MKHYRFLAVLSLILVSLIAGCSKSEKIDAPEGFRAGAITDLKHVESYSYLKIDENGKEVWIAVTRNDAAKAGMPVYFSKYTEMANFTAKSLNMTFDKILFVEDASLSKPGAAGSNTPGNDPSSVMGDTPQKPEIEKTEVKVEKASGGITIAELYASPEKYSGKTVTIKAKAIKVNPEIMEKNWVHIQDGTDHKGSFDLTVTTKELVNVNDIVTFEGKVSLNKDFGYGYSYKILLEDAKVIK